jgi:uncharacterized protein
MQNVLTPYIPMTLSTPLLRAGFGLRKPHYREVIETTPMVKQGAWLEVHSENFFAEGGPALATLMQAREHYPVSLHGVGLSLASAQALDERHLQQLAQLVDQVQPVLVSEHLCWAAVGDIHLNDLLPFAYTTEAVSLVASHISQVQDTLKRPLLVENISRYLELRGSDMSEGEFMRELVQRTGCQLLLDINNVYVNACNLGVDAWQEIQTLPIHAVKEIHLAGYSTHYDDTEDALLIDTHSTQVSPPVWALYERALQRFGALPTLIEWDQDLPTLPVLLQEVAQANHYLESIYRPVSTVSRIKNELIEKALV